MDASWHRTERQDTAPQGQGWRRIAPVRFLPILLSFPLAQELMDCRHSGTHRNHPYRDALPGSSPSPKPPSTVLGPTNPTLQFQHISPGGFRWNQSPSHQHHHNSLLEEMNTPHESQQRGLAWNIHLVFGKKCFSTQKKKNLNSSAKELEKTMRKCQEIGWGAESLSLDEWRPSAVERSENKTFTFQFRCQKTDCTLSKSLNTPPQKTPALQTNKKPETK